MLFKPLKNDLHLNNIIIHFQFSNHEKISPLSRTNCLRLLKKVTAVHSANHTKPMNTIGEEQRISISDRAVLKISAEILRDELTL
jgi:ABC-type ATPase involved in cell division